MPPLKSQVLPSMTRCVVLLVLAFTNVCSESTLPTAAQSSRQQRTPRSGRQRRDPFDTSLQRDQNGARPARAPLHSRPVQPVPDSTEYPWSSVCQVLAYFPDGSIMEGSGAMIGPHHCLTALHLIYKTRTREAANRVRIIPGYDDERPFTEGLIARPFGSTSINQFLFWEPHDIAIIITSSNIGDASSWMTVRSLSDRDLTSQPFQVAGYPRALGGSERQGEIRAEIARVEGDRVILRSECPAGMEGGPIFEETASGRQGGQAAWSIVGVLTGRKGGNRIPPDMQRLLSRFVNDDFSGVNHKIPIPVGR